MITDCNECKYCTPKEMEQTRDKESHMCGLLKKRILHRHNGINYHPMLKPLDGCPLKRIEEICGIELYEYQKELLMSVLENRDK